MKGILSLTAVLVATAGLALAGQAPKSLKLGYTVVPGGPIHDAAIRFGELVKEKSGGSLEIELFHSAALGNDREMCEGLMVGMLDMQIVGAAPISWYIPEYGMIEAPFIFRDYEHMDKVLRGSVGKEIAERLYAKNKLIIIDWWPRGPRYLTTSNRRVESPADLRGLKLRVPEVPAYIATWRLLGANTTPITYSEMFMALKQGVVEGQENPLETIYTSSLYEVQKYLVETKHLLGFFMMMIGQPTRDGLAEDEMKIIYDATFEAGAYEYEKMLEYEAKYGKELIEKGMTLIKPDMAPFRKIVSEGLPVEMRNDWQPGLYEKILAVQ